MSVDANTEFSDRWVLVSGASSGIGRAIAVALAQAGARVALLGRRVDRLQETAALCGAPDRSTVLPIDLLQLDAIGPAIAALAARVGRFYGLCHCAGSVQTLPLAALKPERIRAMFDLNVLAGTELMRALTRRDVMDEKSGSVLWIASVYAHVGAPGQVGYAATKGAIVSAVRSLALEYAPRHVRVNSLSPGFVRTEMTQSGKLTEEQWAKILAMHPLGAGEPEDVARAAVFMLSPRNAWITGSDLIIDGGYTLT
jgi:NAD(P)-dependent dehydrogenase (short-subunit alcohol dehydrogenase family)